MLKSTLAEAPKKDAYPFLAKYDAFAGGAYVILVVGEGSYEREVRDDLWTGVVVYAEPGLAARAQYKIGFYATNFHRDSFNPLPEGSKVVIEV